VDKRK